MQATVNAFRPAAPFARTVLRIDSVSCILSGLAAAVLSSRLPALLGFGSTLVFLAIGADLLLFGEALWLMSGRWLGQRALKIAVAINALWVLGSLAVAIALPLTTLGMWIVLAQADAVAVIAGVEWVALRRMKREAAQS